MHYKIFGRKTGLKVSEFALGTGMFGTTRGYGAEPQEVRAILERYADAGGNFIDTADAYQHGEAERLIGEFLAPRRNGFVLASKFSRGDSSHPAVTEAGANRKTMVQAVEASLKRLKTDRIDLYFVHLDDTVTPAEEIARGFDDLVRAGKIVYGGFSNFPAWRIAVAATAATTRGWAPIAALQTEYSLLERTPEREQLPMADGLGLGIMAWSPLGGGLLTGKYRKGERGRATDLKESVLHGDSARLDPILDTLEAIAAESSANPGQISIAWVAAKGYLPVLGPRTAVQLDDNLAAAALRLTPEQMSRLDAASAVSLGYPHDLIRERSSKTGKGWEQVDFPNFTVA